MKEKKIWKNYDKSKNESKIEKGRVPVCQHQNEPSDVM